jgi:hypothetical protein
VRPKTIACARIDHQAVAGVDRVSGSRNDRLVHRAIDASEGAPPDLERPEPCVLPTGELRTHAGRFEHEDRRIGLDTIAVPAAKEAADGTAGRLAEDVPERDVDPTDRVRDRTAAADPEHAALQLFLETLRFEGRLAPVKRFERSK